MTKKVKDNQSEMSQSFSSEDSDGDEKEAKGNESWQTDQCSNIVFEAS